MKKILSFLIILNIIAYSQEVRGWKTFSNLKNISNISVGSKGIWASSSGGGFFYNFSDNSYETFNKTNGLSGIVLTDVTIDKNGNIWFSSSSGIIDVYYPETKSFKTILDIFSSDRNSKQINELRSAGDTIIVSSDFGISLLDDNNLVFLDTFFKFGSFPSNLKVNSALKAGLIYAATDSGVAVQKTGETNLSAPESWTVYRSAGAVPLNLVSKIINYNGNIIAASKRGLFQFNGTGWQQYLPDLSNINISDIIAKNDSLFILANSTVWLYYQNNLSTLYSSGILITKLGFNSHGLYAASSSGIVSTKDGSLLFPDGPPVNQFPYLAVDNDGNLWATSGINGTGVGFSEYNGKNWKVYDKSNTPVIVNDDYYYVYAAPDNTIYVGNWGFGFVRIKDNRIDNFTTANTDMLGTDQNPDFLVITGFGIDSKDNLWILNSESVNRKTLSMLTPDSVWYHFSIPTANNQFLEKHFNLAIDQYDTKWFCSQDPTRPGLYYFNENGTYTNTNDDKSGYITTSNGLNDNTVTSVLVDTRGDIWVGTGLGVNVINNNGSIFSNAPSLRITSIFTLRQQSINCMAVDPLNQKWIGTNQGLLLVNSDGTNLIASYDSKNSPLPSDIIRSLAVDKNSGTVYVGTDEGIVSFKTPAIEAQDNFTELVVYPSPFVLRGNSNQLTINGLVTDSDIKILTITGKLVTEFSSPGGKIAFWDGKDMKGNYVGSGIYLVVAFDKDGNSAVAGKVAVIKE